MMGFVKEFREFALKGNVMDMAVGIIIGGAFGVIVKSMVDDIVMPLVGMIGNVEFTDLYLPLTEKARTDIAQTAAESASGSIPLAVARTVTTDPILAYGNFITIVINFIILAMAIFVMIKMMNVAKRRFEREQAAAPTPQPGPAADVVLLTEIRDLLKARA